MTVDNALDRCTNPVLVRSYLLHAVSIAQGESVVFERLEIDSDPQRRSQFVVSRVAFTDRGGRVVDAIRYPQLP